MALDAAAAQVRNRWLIDNNTRLLVALSSMLCVTSQLKLAEVQYLEIIYGLELIVLAAWYLPRLTPLKLYRPLFRIGLRWTIFSVVALVLAAIGLKQNFYLEHASALKQPFVVTIARLGELALDVFFMLYLANRYRMDGRLCRFAAWTYYLVGVAGCIYSIVSIPLHLGGVYNGIRMRGFNNEGGSYGTYVMTIIFMAMAMRSEGWISRRLAIFSQILFFINLLGSQSKASLFEVFVFIILTPALRLRGSKLIWATAASVLVVVSLWFALDVNSKLVQYSAAINEYRRVSVLRPKDYNYVVGRVAGLFLAPTMIKTHPWIGIGLGNYPIVRDDPQYRRGTPVIEPPLDSPSLGPIDYIVDLGFPLFLYFTWVELAPAVALVRRREKAGIVCLMLMQPVANWFGAHLNLTFPWVGAAIALGIAYGRQQRQEDDAIEAAAAPSGPMIEAAA
jgi:hypothetical protein